MSDMKKNAYQYAIIRFTPFVETEEFANVGVIMINPADGQLWYKLQTRRYARITKFFDDIDHKLYQATINNVKKELDRIKEYVTTSGMMVGDLFNELVRQRETIIKFSDTRVVLGTDAEVLLDELFKHYVERSFLTKEYKEAAMERSVKEILKVGHLGATYSRRTLSDGIYEASFPFVSNKKTRVIKPLHLAHEKPSQAIDHGMSWLLKINELRDRQVLNDKVLFTVDEPDRGTKVHEAYESLLERFKREDIDVLLYQDSQQIIEFAQL